MTTRVTASAPGSIMITGEHAVVHGHTAIVAAIDQRATVTTRRVASGTLAITSQIASAQTLPMDTLAAQGPYRFVIAAVIAAAPQAPGLEIEVTSRIDPTLGLGSSAAVTVAVLASLLGHAGDSLHATALRIIRDIQGRGSGADLAASLRGGVLAYDGSDPPQFAPLPAPPQLSLFNVGYKTPTSEVLARLARAYDTDPARYDALYQKMGTLSAASIEAVAGSGWEHAAPDLNRYQEAMEDLGVSDSALGAAVAVARGSTGVHAAKISGSGLGDCVLAMGAVPNGFVPVTVAREGVMFHDTSS